jgi:hypothetical protein
VIRPKSGGSEGAVASETHALDPGSPTTYPRRRMDLINHILTNVVSQLVADVAVGAYRAVATAIRSRTRNPKASKVLEILTRLDQVGEGQIRRLVRQARFPAPSVLPSASPSRLGVGPLY